MYGKNIYNQYYSHTFASSGNLTRHIHAVYDKLRPFTCQYYIYANLSETDLRNHIEVVPFFGVSI